MNAGFVKKSKANLGSLVNKMHRMVLTIVYAKSRSRAIDEAKKKLNDLTGDDRAFDYYQLFNTTDDHWETAGTGRFGKHETCYELESKEGTELLNKAIESTKNELFETCDYLKLMLATHSPEELWQHKGGKCSICETLEKEKKTLHHCDMFTYLASEMPSCKRDCTNVYVYHDLEPVTDLRTLGNVLNKYKTLYEDSGKPNPHADDKIWIIPADVHF